MGFFSRKSKAAEPVASDFVSFSLKSFRNIFFLEKHRTLITILIFFQGNDATKRLASVEEDLKAANLKVDLLTGQLADANHNVNQVTFESS